MDKMILFNTSISSQNMGDYIICNSCKKEISNILEGNFTIELPTHTPVIHFYQGFNKNKLVEYCNDSKLKFATGSNLLAYNMLRPWPNFNVNIFDYKPFKNLILMGCGSNPNKSKKVNLYTKYLYKKILSKEYIHSVRDDRTKKMIEELGFKAINTGCATMWKFTKGFCQSIPKEKTNNVVFTLTDYCKDIKKDQMLIDILIKNYENVYFWVQGSADLVYFKTFKNIDNIKIIGPTLEEYEKVLNTDVDYIGTRLHAGIFAMQHKRRTIIIAIDNRTRDMNETYNLNSIERDEIEDLNKIINSSFRTEININIDKIQKWKEQFMKK